MPRFPRTPILAAFLAATSLPAAAALQPVSEAPLAEDAEFQCRFGNDNSTECLSTYRYTILTQAGRDMVSRIDRSYAENDSLEVLRAEVIQPGEKPVALDAAQIDTRMAPNPEQGFLRQKQTSLAFPSLRVGSAIVFTLRERFAVVPHATHFHYVMEQAPRSVRQDRFHGEFLADRPMVWRAQAMDDFRVNASADGKRIVVDLKSAPRYLSYIDEPERGYLRRSPRLEVGSATAAQDYFGPFAGRYNEILAAALPKAAAVAAQAARNRPPGQAVASLMRHINDHYRYLGDWRGTERGQIPFSLQEIESHGYGDCKDLAILLTAMLRGAGIKAEPALVVRGTVAPELLLPGLFAPNHAIVRAEVDGAIWWLDPTNLVFVPGLTMQDLQQRWALVFDDRGGVRREDIPLASPSQDGLAVVRHERFRGDGQAEVRASVVLSGMSVASLFLSERQNGKVGMDQVLCRNFAVENRDCVLRREPGDFVMPPAYRLDAELVDLKPVERVGDHHIRAQDYLTNDWEDFARYRRSGQLADVYLGAPETMAFDVTLTGATVESPALHCTLRSSWFDLDLDGEPTDAGYRYRYKSVRKTAWFSHAEIMSDAFGKAVEQGRACADQLRMAVKLPPA